MKVSIGELPDTNAICIGGMVPEIVYRFQEYLIIRDDSDGVIVVDTSMSNKVRVYSNYYELDEYIDGCTMVETTNLTLSLIFK